MKLVCGKVNLEDLTFTTTKNLAKSAVDDVEKIVAQTVGNQIEKYVTSIFIPMAEKMILEELKITLESDATYAFMPQIYAPRSDGMGSTPCDDPLAVYFRIDLGTTDDTGQTLETSLETMLNDEINQCAEDGSFRFGLARIRDGLRGLADRIDKAISLGPSELR